MEELEIKVIDACRKYISEKGGFWSEVKSAYRKNSTLIECVKDVSTIPYKSDDLFGTITMRKGKIHMIDSISDKNFKEYILKELNNKK